MSAELEVINLPDGGMLIPTQEVLDQTEVPEALSHLRPPGLDDRAEGAWGALVERWDEDFRYFPPSDRLALATLARQAATAYVRSSAFGETPSAQTRHYDAHYRHCLTKMDEIKTRTMDCQELAKELLRDVVVIFQDSLVDHCPPENRRSMSESFMRPILELMGE